MDTSKKVFAIIAGIMVLTCVLLFLFLWPEQEDPIQNSTAASSAASESTTPLDGGDFVDPENYTGEITLPPEETLPPVLVGNDVTIKTIPRDPAEQIDRTAYVDESHPEFIPGVYAASYLSSEGKVYCNDRTISINIYDALKDETVTVSFGYATGKCNRFLYLNPQVITDQQIAPYNFFFNAEKGSIVTIPDAQVDPGRIRGYMLKRALEDKAPATYFSAKTPGTVWFTQPPLEKRTFIDTLVLNWEGDYIATLRLTIEKAEDGTYYLADLDNRDLLQNGGQTTDHNFTEAELDYIIDCANTTLHDTNTLGLGITHEVEGTFVYEKSRFLIAYIDLESDMYFDELIPRNGGSKYSRRYKEMLMPMLAVTVRNMYSKMSMTLYYQIYRFPTETEHGYYYYIGRDYHAYNTLERLQAFGYGKNPLE